MNALIYRSVLGTILLTLSACAHYQQPVYNRYAAPYPAYGGGYVVRERNYYYGGYPYRYDSRTYADYGNYGYDHGDDHHHREYSHHRDDPGSYSNRSRQKNLGNLKPNPAHDRRQYPGSRKIGPLAIDDRIYGFPGRRFNHSPDRNDRPDKPYGADGTKIRHGRGNAFARHEHGRPE